MVEKITKKLRPAAVDYTKGIPELLEFVAKDDIQVELRKQTAILKQQENLGIEDPRTLHLTPTVQILDFIHGDPYRPWVSIFLENTGPNIAFIGINQPARPVAIPPGATRVFGHASSLNKISLLYCWCNPGESATVNVVGQY